MKECGRCGADLILLRAESLRPYGIASGEIKVFCQCSSCGLRGAVAFTGWDVCRRREITLPEARKRACQRWAEGITEEKTKAANKCLFERKEGGEIGGGKVS